MTREEIVDVIDILYVKIMRLNLSYQMSSIFVLNQLMENEFPDIVYALKCSFGIDAYTTIHALLKDDQYSFGKLAKESSEYADCFNKAKSEIEKECPQIREVRNKVICHFDIKQDECYFSQMYLAFSRIFTILATLHENAMKLFKIDCKEIRVMTTDKFTGLSKQKMDFYQLLYKSVTEYIVANNHKK